MTPSIRCTVFCPLRCFAYYTANICAVICLHLFRSTIIPYIYNINMIYIYKIERCSYSNCNICSLLSFLREMHMGYCTHIYILRGRFIHEQHFPHIFFLLFLTIFIFLLKNAYPDFCHWRIGVCAAHMYSFTLLLFTALSSTIIIHKIYDEQIKNPRTKKKLENC